MVVSAAIQAVFVPGNAILKINFKGQAALRQYLERSIYRCVTNAGILRLYELVQVFRTEVIASVQKHFENAIPLRALLEPSNTQKRIEDSLSDIHAVFARTVRVIDPLFSRRFHSVLRPIIGADLLFVKINNA